MNEKFIMKIGEALVAGGPAGTAAEPEVVIGELDGPFGTAFANLIGDQSKGHSKVLAIMNTDIMVKPATLMVSKVTVKENRYTNILMGTVQAAIANGVLDSVRNGDIPKERANDLGVIVSVWLNPSVSNDDNLDHKILFDIHRLYLSIYCCILFEVYGFFLYFSNCIFFDMHRLFLCFSNSIL